MHNEELGLLKKEITFLYSNLPEASQQVLDTRLQGMPTCPNFPKFTGTLGKPSNFKAKHWIVISKYICCAVHGVHTSIFHLLAVITIYFQI